MKTSSALPAPEITLVHPSEALPLTGMLPSDFADGDLLVYCQWPDRSGFYVRSADGTLHATISNQSEVFATHAEARAWIHARVEVADPMVRLAVDGIAEPVGDFTLAEFLSENCFAPATVDGIRAAVAAGRDWRDDGWTLKPVATR